MAKNEYVDLLRSSTSSNVSSTENEYIDLLRNKNKTKDAVIKSNIKSAVTEDPLQVFKTQSLSNVFGLPRDIVKRNLPEVEANAKAMQWEDTIKNSPTLREFMTDSYFAGIAHQDKSLVEAEKVLRTKGFAEASRVTRDQKAKREVEFNAWANKPEVEWARSWGDVPSDIGKSAGQSFSYLAKGAVEGGRMVNTPIRRAIQAMSPELSKQYEGIYDATTDYLTGFSDFLQSQKSTEMQAKSQRLNEAGLLETAKMVVTDPAIASDLLAQSAAYLIPATAAGRAGPVAANIYAALSEGLDSAATAREEAKAAGVDTFGQDAAAAKALFTSAPLAFVANKVLKLGDIESEFFKTGKVGNAFTTLIKEAIGGAVEEASNTLGVNVAAVTGYEPQRDITQGVAKSAVLGSVLETTQAAGMKGISIALETIANRSDKAQEDLLKVETIKEHMKIAAGSEVRNMDSNTFSQFSQAIMDDNDELPSEVFIDAGVFNQIMQEANIDPNIIDGMQDQLNDSIAGGTDIAIPYGELSAKLSGTEAEQAVVRNMKIEQDGRTTDELIQYAENIKDELAKEIISSIGDEEKRTAFENSANVVYDDFLSQLNKVSPYGVEANKLQAIIAKEYFATRSLNDPLGRTPEQIYNIRRVQIQGESVTTGDVLTQESPQFKAWFGKSKIVDTSGKPLIVYHGTKAEFDTFSLDKMGLNGLSLGAGFYFTNSRSVAEGYGSPMAVYLSAKNPTLSADKRTITKAQVKSVIGKMEKLDEYFLSNYGDIEYEGRAKVMNLALDDIYYGSKNDAEIISSIINVGGVPRDSVMRAIIEVTGKDGLVADAKIASFAAEEADKIYTVLLPEQIKSVSNEGTYSLENANIYKQDQSPIFYSALYQGIDASKLKDMPASQWKSWLAGNASKLGIKKEEIEWTGLNEYFDLIGEGKISKQDILNYLSQNGVKVQDVTLVEPDESDIEALLNDEAGEGMTREDAIDFLKEGVDGMVKFGGAKFELAGGKNYRELLLTLPNKLSEIDSEYQAAKSKYNELLMLGEEDENLNSEIERLAKLRDKEYKKSYQSEHWKDKNVLSHIRLNDRLDNDGRRVLFIEEIQSDWAQEGRDKGFVKQYNESDVQSLPPDSPEATQPDLFWYFKVPNNVLQISKRQYKTEQDAFNYIISEKVQSGIVPTGPFVGDTKSWASLTVKRIMRYAADNGYDKVAFINGDQMHQRFPKKKNGESTKEAFDYFYNTLVPSVVNDQLKKVDGGKITDTNIGELNQPAFEVTDAMREQILKGLPLFQGFNGQALGTFDPNNFIISLKKGANLSTFAHELGHYFLEMNTILASERDADPQLVADVNATMQWFGTDLGTWRRMSVNDKRNSHEKFARTWEAYLFKGEAPSEELRTVFQRFTSWMTSVYRSLKDFLTGNGVELTPEITQVFDRMLATQDQIEAAKKRNGLSALFKTADEGGMTDEELFEYQSDLTGVTSEAIEIMNKRSLADIKWLRRARDKVIREFQKDGEAKRREVQIEARREIMSQPIYQAWSFLTAKEWGKVAPKKKTDKSLDPSQDSLFTAIRKLGGISRDKAISEWGVDPADAKKWPRVFVKEGGMSVDGMAETLSQFGYITTDVHGKYDLTDLEDALFQELNGDPYYSLAYDYTQDMDIEIGEQIDIAKQLPAGRLNLEMTKGILGIRFEEAKSRLGNMLASDGLLPDVVAELFVDENGNRAFGSGVQLINELANAIPPSQAIQELTDKMVLERYGDLTSDKAKQEAADEALHNEAMLRSAATEMKAITGMQGGRRELLKAAKDAAFQAIQNVKVKDLRPSKYITAAIKYGKEADNAVKSKDTVAAATAKRRQILNIAMAQRAYEVETEIRKAMNDFAKLNRSDKALSKTHDINLVDTARAVLASFGLNSADPNTALDSLANVKAYNPDLYTTLEAIVQTVTSASRDEKGEFVGYRKLSTNEFFGLRDAIRQLTNQARSERTITVNGKKVELDQARQELIEQLAKNDGKIVYDGLVRAPTEADEMRFRMMSLKSVMTRMEHWVHMQDRANFNGPFRTYIFQEIMNGIVNYRIAKKDIYEKYKDLLAVKRKDPTFLVGEIAAPELNYAFRNKAELLGALQHIGNDGNKKKNLVGRGWASTVIDEDGNKSIDYSKWDSFLNRMFAEGIVTKEDMDIVQAIWDMNESIKPAAQQAHFNKYGYYFDEVTAVEIVTPFGTYRGGYMPATPDKNANVNSQIRDLMNTLEENFSFMMPSTPSGFTKTRVEYNVPLTMDLRLGLQSMDKVLRFTHIDPAVNDVNKLFGKNGGLTDALFDFDRSTLPDLITPWLNRVVNQTSTDQYKSAVGKKFGKYLEAVVRNTGLSIMAGNIKNALEQYTGTYVARAEVETKYIRNAQAKYIFAPDETSRFVSEMSKWMGLRLDNQMTEYLNEIEGILEEKTALKTVQELSMKHGYVLQRTVQNQLDIVIWMAAFEKGQETLNEDQAVEYADSVIRRTQSTLNPEDVSSIESGTAGYKLFTQFYNYFNNIINFVFSNATVTIKELGLRKGSGKLFALYFYTIAVPALVSGALKRTLNWQWDDEDDDGYLDEFMDWFIGDQFRYINAFMPLGSGQALTAFINRANDNPMDDRVSLSPAISMLDTMAGAIPTAWNAIFEDGNVKKSIKDILTVVSVISGVPVSVIGKPAGYISDIREGNVYPENELDLVRGLISGKGREEERQ